MILTLRFRISGGTMPSMSIEFARKQAEPYTKIVEELPRMRERRCSWRDRP